MSKKPGLFKLAGIFFAALLILAASLLLILAMMINRLKPPFSATLFPAGTSSPEPITQQSTGLVNTPQPTPSLSVPTQTRPTPVNPNQSWKQGMLVYLVRNPSGYNSMYMLNLETGSEPRLLLQPTTNQHYYGPWLSPDSSKVVFYDINGLNGILDLQDLSIKLLDACNSPT